eukprot:jgi/Orpsp1_1/1191432/evm.model.d7180000085780.1
MQLPFFYFFHQFLHLDYEDIESHLNDHFPMQSSMHYILDHFFQKQLLLYHKDIEQFLNGHSEQHTLMQTIHIFPFRKIFLNYFSFLILYPVEYYYFLREILFYF